MKNPALETQPSVLPTASAQSKGSRPTFDDRSDVVPALFGGRYQLQGLIGAGGTGTVFRALDIELGEVIALKVLRREVIERPQALDRFRSEVRLSRRITHRNVARMYDIGEHLGEKFLTMELVDGLPLSHVMGVETGQTKPLPLSRALSITTDICSGLQAAHDVGIVHRDLKPENVLLATDGRVVLTDFGIARAIEQNGQEVAVAGLLGTPEYMAPEQVDGSTAVCPATDLYALGVTMFEMLTGKLPFTAHTPMLTAMKRLLNDPPDPRSFAPDLPPHLAALVLRCLNRDPKLRPQSAVELAQSLSTFFPSRTTGSATSSKSAGDFPTPDHDTVMSRQKTVAVLPLRNHGAPGDNYLAEGLTEELIDVLSATKGLRVRSRGASMSVKEDQREARILGLELGVQLVVDGSLRRAGDTLRLTLRLIHVENGFQVWAQRFDGKVADLFQLSDAASLALAQALTSQLAQTPERTRISDAQAVEKYFRARQLYHTASAANLAEAVACFEEILVGRENDPKLLAAYAMTQARRWFFGELTAAEKARATAEKVLRLAPNSADAHLALALVQFQDADLPNTVLSLRRSLARAPTLADAHDLLGRILVETGPVHEGIRSIEIALDIDPSLLRLQAERARALELLGQQTVVDAIMAKIRPRPASSLAAFALAARLAMWRKDPAYAKATLEQATGTLVIPEGLRDITEAVAYARDLDIGAIHQKLPIRTGSQRAAALFFQIAAEWHGYRGNAKEVVYWLGHSVDNGLIDLVWLDLCPLFRPLAHDPQFLSLRRIVADRVSAVHSALAQPVA